MRIAASVLIVCAAAFAQWKGNHDESKVRPYTLPDPLETAAGRKVASKDEWMKVRRPEILRLYESEVYGKTPAKKVAVKYEVVEESRAALGGKAVRKQVRMSFPEHAGAPAVDVLMYLPQGKGPWPVFVGLNFTGNHTVNADPAIRIAQVWDRKTQTKAKDAESSRGKASSRWVVEEIVARGYGVVTAYYEDIEPDFDGGLKYGVRSMFLAPGKTEFAADEWGALGGWAWALSRMADYLVTDKDVDAKRMALMGHSRLGKTALWAGAQDERWSIVISNESGEGGAALARRNFGEDVERINAVFPHWFARNFRKYGGRESELPVDQHMLLALIAPRPVYVASAAEDLHADPEGERLATVHAAPVYKLPGMPGAGAIGYHVRPGEHDVKRHDWEQFMGFAGKHWGK